MRRIAILGGTFNPVHNAHLYLIRAFSELLQAERVLTVVTNVPPHKLSPDLASNAHRLQMCRLAQQEEPRLEPCDLELHRKGKSYTCDTLRELREQNPDAQLYFITGADMFLTLLEWRNPAQIFRDAVICAAPRSSQSAEQLRAYDEQRLRPLGARTIITEMTPPDISSTEIRRRVAAGEPIDGLVPAAVADYIYQNGLYQKRSRVVNDNG